jgi:hypothetical protein
MSWRYLSPAERIEIALLSLAFVAGCAAVGWLVIVELCR